MARSSAAQEPSMEEILASIRNIIESGEDRSSVSRPEPEASAGIAPRAPELPAAGVSEPVKPSEPVLAPRNGANADDAAAFFDVDFQDLRSELEQEFAAEKTEVPIAPTPAEAFRDGFPSLQGRIAEPGWDAGWPQRSDGRHAALRAAATIAVDRRDADGMRRSTPTGAPERREPLEDKPVADRLLEEMAGQDRQPQASSGFMPANNDERRMGDYRAAVIEDAVSPTLPLPTTGGLLSERTGGLVGASFEELSRAIREGQLRSMDEMAEDLMRPMLQDWLDENLPKLVERLVREEIERVARGGR